MTRVVRVNPRPMDLGVGTLKSASGNAVSVHGGGSWVEVQSMVIAAGTWLIVYGGAFYTGSNVGNRRIYLSVAGSGRFSPTSPGVPGEQTRFEGVYAFTASQETTLRLYASQSSGSAMDFYPYIQAVRLA